MSFSFLDDLVALVSRLNTILNLFSRQHILVPAYQFVSFYITIGLFEHV